MLIMFQHHELTPKSWDSKGKRNTMMPESWLIFFDCLDP